MKTLKLVGVLTVSTFLFTAGLNSSAYCQQKTGMDRGKIVSPTELRGLSPQPEPPDRGIRDPDRKMNTCNPEKVKDIDPKSK